MYAGVDIREAATYGPECAEREVRRD